MNNTVDRILQQALKLPVGQRAELGARLLDSDSFDTKADKDGEADWVAENQRRVQKVRSGQGQFDDWDAVKERLRP